jgi:hypothetical protein
MRFASCAALTIVSALMLGVTPGQAAPSGREQDAAAVGYSSQARDDRARRPPRARLRVYPRELYPYPCRNYHAAFVLPYDYECPGPNAVRRCDFRLVQEHRPSGTVIVPRQRCWWARR